MRLPKSRSLPASPLSVTAPLPVWRSVSSPSPPFTVAVPDPATVIVSFSVPPLRLLPDPEPCSRIVSLPEPPSIVTGTCTLGSMMTLSMPLPKAAWMRWTFA